VRAGLKMLSLVAFFFAISMAALSDVTAIAFTTPVFLTVGAWIFLREKPVPVRVLAVKYCTSMGTCRCNSDCGNSVNTQADDCKRFHKDIGQLESDCNASHIRHTVNLVLDKARHVAAYANGFPGLTWRA